MKRSGLADFSLRLHIRSDLHLTRKIWHLGMGTLIAGIYASGMERSTGIWILGSVLTLALMVEAARLRVPGFNQKVLRVWGPFMRNCEVSKMTGAPHYMASTILAIAIFPKPVALLAILFLAIGDPIASLVGILYGDRGPRFSDGKSLIGTAAGVSACMILAFVFVLSLHATPGQALLVALLGGLAGGTAELLPVELDDNLTIPIVSGFVTWLAFMWAGL